MNETIPCHYQDIQVGTQTYEIRHNHIRRYNNYGKNCDERAIENVKKYKYFTCKQE